MGRVRVCSFFKPLNLLKSSTSIKDNPPLSTRLTLRSKIRWIVVGTRIRIYRAAIKVESSHINRRWTTKLRIILYKKLLQGTTNKLLSLGIKDEFKD